MIQRNTQNVVRKIRRRKLVIKTLQVNRQGAYHSGAVMLQALWRGHWSRKTIHDFYGRYACEAAEEAELPPSLIVLRILLGGGIRLYFGALLG